MHELYAIAMAVLSMLGASSGSTWHPQVGDTFFWQLSGNLRVDESTEIYDIDAFSALSSTIEELHGNGYKVVCYISAGSYETWRPDVNDFPRVVLGKTLDGWKDERWLDIRRKEVRSIIAKRIAICARQGYDGIEFDNVDGYANDTGFELTAKDQLNFNRWLAARAHERGLAAGLKNDTDQVEALVDDFEFSVVEQCFEFDECEQYLPFIRAGKPVFDAEYSLPLKKFCAKARELEIFAARYSRELDGRQWRC